MVDTMIRLFESTATSFVSNGLGALPDASKCEVVEERNGSYELELEYHISGKRYSEIRLRRIIVAKPTPFASPQPFRIYNISKPINGLVNVKAEHISYDMSGYPVDPFKAENTAEAFRRLKEHSIADNPFIFSTDKDVSAALEVLKPASMRALLGGSENSILDVYGGEYEFDGFRTTLHTKRGTDRGVTIRYGKNLMDLTQEENCSNVYTAVYPFFYSDEWGMVELPEKIVQASGTYDYTRIYPLDVSSDWQNLYEWEDQYPSEDEIRELAVKYIADNNIGVPKVSLTVSFEQLSQSNEYAALELLEKVQLCDTVTVEFPKLNVSAASKCIKTAYNVLTGKYVSIELGDAKSNLASTIVSQNTAVDKIIDDCPTKTSVAQTVKHATQLISGGLGGYVVIRSSKDNGFPDEILIMDTNDLATAHKVWRWNKGGLGYSSNGYDGPYSTAITQDGSIVADFITTGALTADVIRGGTLTVGGRDNAEGVIEIRDAFNNLLMKLSEHGIAFFNNGGAAVTKIVNDTLETTNVVAENLHVAAANITGVIKAGEFRYEDDNYECSISDGISIRNKTENVETSYSISGKYGSVVLFPDGLYFYSGENFRGAMGSLYFSDNVLHVDRALDIGTYSIRAGNDGYATIVDCGTSGKFYYGAARDYTDESSVSALRGKTVRIYSHSGGAVYLGSSGTTAVTSDENMKNIFEFDSRYEKFFFNLTPITYTYKKNGHRKHIGYGARAVEKALSDAGLTTEEFAGIVIDKDVTIGADEMGTEKDVHFNELYSLRYEEFGALYAHMLKKAWAKIEEQQKKLEDLECKLEEVLIYMKEGK